MSGLRFMIDFFVPLDSITEKVNSELQKDVDKIRADIIKLQSYVAKINTGTKIVEDTTKATFHRCYHDEKPPKPCDPEKDILEWTKDSGPKQTIIKTESLVVKVWNIIKKVVGK